MNRLIRLLCFAMALTLLALPFAFSDAEEPVRAFDSAIVVTQNGDLYSYTADATTYGPFASLQDLVDDALEASDDLALFQFPSAVSSTSPVTFSKNVSLNGSLAFSLSTDTYALTALRGVSVTIAGGTIVSNKGGVKVADGASLTLVSGTIRVQNNESFGCSAIRVEGTATIQGGTIRFDSAAGGDGISVTDSASLTISAIYPVSVVAPTAIRLQGGTTVIDSGTYEASGQILPGLPSGYALEVLNASAVTVNGGSFSDPVYLTGQNATVTLNGGSFDSFRSVYFPSGFSGSVNILGTDFTPPAYGYISLDLNDLTENKASFTTEKGYDGYRVASVLTNGERYAPEEVFTLGETLTTEESNTYRLRLFDGETEYERQTHPYNTTIACADLPFAKIGYAPTAYRKNSPSGSTISSVTLDDDVDVYVESDLLPCSVTVANAAFIYSGEAHVVTPTIAHPLQTDPSATIAYRWEKFVASEWTEITTEKTLTVTTVSDGGTYRFTATVSHDGDQTNETVPCAITVQKGTYAAVSHPALQGKYDPEKTLDAYALNDSFRWKTPSTVPTVPVTAYPAIYNADPDNYFDFDVSVTLILEKADAVYPDNTLYASVTGVYDPTVTLASGYVLDGTRWDDPDAVLTAGTHECVAYYAPDPDNYLERLVYVTITVDKATYTDKDISISVAYTPSLGTLTGIRKYVAEAFPGYAVTDGAATTSIGENRYACVYVGDQTNYYDYAFELVVTVSKGTYEGSIPSHETVRLPYGVPLSSATLNDSFSFVDPSVVPQGSGAFDAVYNVDPDHYEDAVTSIYVELVKLVYSPEEIPDCNLSPIVYDPSRTLGDLALPNGFSWKNATLVPTHDVPIYEAIYQGDVWHERADVSVALTVHKATVATPVLSGRTFTYDGKPHALVCENLSPLVTVLSYEGNGKTDAGTYQVTARLSQADTVNYEAVPTELCATMTIEKAESVILSPDRVEVLVGTTFEIEARADNDEQTVRVPSVSTSEKGVFTIQLLTDASVNYRAGQKNVIVSVNEEKTFVGNIVYPKDYDGTYYYGILSAENGVSSELHPSFDAIQKDGQTGVRLSFGPESVAGDATYTVRLLMPDPLLRATDLRVLRNGKEVTYSIESDVYLVFDGKNGDELYFSYTTNAKKFIWYWIPPVAAFLVAAGVLAFLWKKGIIRFPRRKQGNKNA